MGRPRPSLLESSRSWLVSRVILVRNSIVSYVLTCHDTVKPAGHGYLSLEERRIAGENGWHKSKLPDVVSSVCGERIRKAEDTQRVWCLPPCAAKASHNKYS